MEVRVLKMEKKCKDIPVSASDFVPSRLLIDQLCISIFQIYSTENIILNVKTS